MSRLTDMYKECVTCVLCEDLVKSRTRVVPGDGPENAEIMFVGEAPGFNEDQQGHPFVGAAGQFLNQMLESVGMKRSNVYVTNVIKCRPANNREPFPSEIHNCQKWLTAQLDIMHPRVVVTLGRFSLTKFFPTEVISKAHGKARWKDGVLFYAMYHPAAALHQGSLRKTLEEDMKRLPSLITQIHEVKPPPAEKQEEKPQQLSMF